VLREAEDETARGDGVESAGMKKAPKGAFSF
jgi:hypothetical protein